MLVATESPPLAVLTAEAGRQSRQGRTAPTDLFFFFGGNTETTPVTRTENEGNKSFNLWFGFSERIYMLLTFHASWKFSSGAVMW